MAASVPATRRFGVHATHRRDTLAGAAHRLVRLAFVAIVAIVGESLQQVSVSPVIPDALLWTI
jgi:hypothetical protein